MVHLLPIDFHKSGESEKLYSEVDDLITDRLTEFTISRERETSGHPLEETDQRILGELSLDGRMSMRSLDERLHISRANASARVNRCAIYSAALPYDFLRSP